MRAVGYVRVSTEEQATSGLGLEAQRKAIAELAERLQLELGQVFADEGVSGALAASERPGLSRAIAELGRGEFLLTAKLDRLGRSVLEVLLLERELAAKSARFRSAAGEGTESSDPTMRFMMIILLAVSELELALIHGRTKSALAAKRARGERTGSLPFGFALGEDGKLEPDREEQGALALMLERRAAGDGFLKICRALERAGARPRGKAWYPSSVRSILETHARGRGV